MNRKTDHQTLISRKLWRSIFLIAFPFGIISFILPIYTKALGASAFELGQLIFVFLILPVLIRPFLGQMLDKWGRRPFLLIGFCGYALAMIVFSFADRIEILTLARFIQGLGQAFLWISANTIIADLSHQDERGYHFGLIDEATNRGAIIGTGLGISFIFIMEQFHQNWRSIWFWLFAFYTIPALLAVRNAWHGIPETKTQITTRSMKKLPLTGQLITLMTVVFLSGFSSFTVFPFLMLFLQDVLKADFMQITLAYLPAALIGAFLPSRMGRFTDQIGRKKLMAIGLLISALTTWWIPFLHSLLPLSVLWAAQALAITASAPAELAYVADIAGEEQRGAGYGFYTFAFFLGGALGPLAGGWLYDREGRAFPFYLNTILLLIGAFLVVFVLKETLKPKEGEIHENIGP